MAIEPIKGFYVHDEETDTDGVAKYDAGALENLDRSLTERYRAPDSKAVGDRFSAVEAVADEANEIAKRLNEGGLELKDEVLAENISAWLNEHPEATTTVEDGALTQSKLSNSLDARKPSFYSTVSEMQEDEQYRLGAIAISDGAVYTVRSAIEVNDPEDMVDPSVLYKYDGQYYNGGLTESDRQIATGYECVNGFAVFVADYKNAYVTPEMFGAKGDGTADDTAAIQAAASIGGLIIFGKSKTYRIKASGFSSFNGVSINKKTIIYGNNSTLEVVDDTDYRSVIYATADCAIYDLNIYEANNNISSQTGTAEQNSRKTIWARHAACILNNVNISNAVGNHQLLVTNDGKPSAISNCTISFSENSEVTYDRTMVYLEGGNITFENNVLDSNNNAHTAIETHGANIIVRNNSCINDFETGLYITNTAPAHNVVVKNNYLSCKRGITLWFEGSHPVGTVEIDNNIVNQTDGDYYVFNLYDVYNAASVECVLISNNELRQSTSTKQPIYFNPTRGNGGNIKKVVFENNYIICGSTNYVFEITSNNHNTVNLECFEIIRNNINCGGARPVHVIASDGRVNNIIFSENVCKNNGVSGMANIAITTPQGFFDFIDNELENPLTGLVAGNGIVNTRVFGNVNIDLRAHSAREAKVANVYALNGDRLVTKGSRINKELSDTQKLTGSTIYTTGDIIWNSAPLIGQPIGWVSLDHDNFRPFGVINQS